LIVIEVCTRWGRDELVQMQPKPRHTLPKQDNNMMQNALVAMRWRSESNRLTLGACAGARDPASDLDGFVTLLF
jgi:hypothetical protein